jgi:DNA-binding MarR family transcriptional regulator
MRCVGDDHLSLLMALRTQGLASVGRAAAAAGLDTAAAANLLREFADAGLVRQREGKHTGFMLLPTGGDRLEALLEEEGLRTSEELSDNYDRFNQLNTRVLKVCSDWQLRSDTGSGVPNDHSDPGYDGSVIERLVDLNGRASSVVGKIANCAQRYAPYGDRLEACVQRLADGDHAAFTAVMAESYHTVWFELHQDLLLTLGLERES